MICTFFVGAFIFFNIFYIFFLHSKHTYLKIPPFFVCLAAPMLVYTDIHARITPTHRLLEVHFINKNMLFFFFLNYDKNSCSAIDILNVRLFILPYKNSVSYAPGPGTELPFFGLNLFSVDTITFVGLSTFFVANDCGL